MSNFRQESPRRITLWEAQCYGMPELFVPWESMSEEAKNEFEENGGVSCEGSGVPGPWCIGCRFGEMEEVTE